MFIVVCITTKTDLIDLYMLCMSYKLTVFFEYGVCGLHSGLDVVSDMTVQEPCARIQRTHGHCLEGSGEQIKHVCSMCTTDLR